MADVEIKYKGETIAELDGTGSKALATKKVWCEEDIEVIHNPRCKAYEITVSRNAGWTLLTKLDDDVLSHINDPGLVVSLYLVRDNIPLAWSQCAWLAGNTPIISNDTTQYYGCSSRENASGVAATMTINAPANNTDGSLTSSCFRISEENYYVLGNGTGTIIRGGTYRLTFTW